MSEKTPSQPETSKRPEPSLNGERLKSFLRTLPITPYDESKIPDDIQGQFQKAMLTVHLPKR